MGTASATVWIQLIGLGCLLGALGQGVRAIVGLKKVSDGVANSTKSVGDVLELSRLFTSLLIGAIAGALAAIGLIGVTDHVKELVVSAPQVTALLGAGYAGADFIEGFMNRAVGDPDAPAGSSTTATGPATGTGTPTPPPNPAQ